MTKNLEIKMTTRRWIIQVLRNLLKFSSVQSDVLIQLNLAFDLRLF